jgi:predicted pyridoxine 5'-phosphate oxidase superfamily flavin-nucleotide-binding protein
MGYHEGELEAQRRAGVAAAAARLEALPRAEIPPVAQQFVATQSLAIVASTDARGRLWASALSGAPGFLRAVDDRTLLARARPAPGDPLRDNLEHDAAAGLLIIDPAARRRLRVNGHARWIGDGRLEVVTDEVYANCPKYIQRREPDGASPAPAGAARRARALTPEARALIAAADTLFIATRHPGRGADASHRGGEPGWVQVEREADGTEVLRIPDYAGNNMLNTLGNLMVEPRAGLLFLDFERGGTLQLTGTAEVRWDGAVREVAFRVDEAVELPGALGYRWRRL